jgi:hypothetical protein
LAPAGVIYAGYVYTTDADMKVRVDTTVQGILDDPPSAGECAFRVGQTAAQALSLGAVKEDRFVELLEEIPKTMHAQLEQLPARIIEKAEQIPENIVGTATTFAAEAPDKAMSFIISLPEQLEEKYEHIKTRVETGEWPVKPKEETADTAAEAPVPVAEKIPEKTPEQLVAALEDRLKKLRGFEKGLKLTGDVLRSVRKEKKRVKDALRE